MRDPARIKKFCDELAAIWESKVPDWRFGQLICNVLGVEGMAGKDMSFYIEDEKLMEHLRNYFRMDDNRKED